MAEVLNSATGRWWRFNRYEIHGDYIRPAPGAELHDYDPWEEYAWSKSDAYKRATPYESLMSLVQHLEWEPPNSTGQGTGNQGEPQTLTAMLTDPMKKRTFDGRRLTPASQKELLEWCNRYGLLGIALHRTVFVAMPPRWERSDLAGVASDDLGDSQAVLNPVQRTYFFEGGRWTSSATFGVVDKVPSGVRAGYLVEGNQLPLLAIPPMVAIRSHGWRGPRVESFDVAWGRNFPGLADPASSPAPFSTGFWLEYAEHVDEFCELAGLLCAAVVRPSEVEQWAQNAPALSVQPEGASRLATHLANAGCKVLDSLTAPACPATSYVPGQGFIERLASPSLITSLAMMARQDLVAGRTPHRCAGCGISFLSNRPEARYCSSQCRHRVQKRIQRAAKGNGGKQS